MKYIRFLFLLTLSCTVFAAENKHIFVGQIATNGVEKSVFLLNLLDEADLQNCMAITEDGEVYIKVDKIVAIPQSEIANFLVTGLAPQYSGFNRLLAADESPEIQCRNSNCRYWYAPRSCNGRKCPRCGTMN
jgi:hypothetical protein